MTRHYNLYLEDIRDSVNNIAEFIHCMSHEAFVQDKKTQSAVIRELEIIGEDTKNIPGDITDANPELPWREMARMRDKLIHGYFSINVEILWKTVSERIPSIKPLISKILQ